MFIIPLLAIINFIQSNPGVAAAVVGGLFTILLGVVGAYTSLITGRLARLEDKWEKYVSEEEDQVWAGMRALTAQLAEMKLENQEAHANIIATFSPRMEVMETKISGIEKKMPNGELREALSLLKILVSRA